MHWLLISQTSSQKIGWKHIILRQQTFITAATSLPVGIYSIPNTAKHSASENANTYYYTHTEITRYSYIFNFISPTGNWQQTR